VRRREKQGKKRRRRAKAVGDGHEEQRLISNIIVIRESLEGGGKMGVQVEKKGRGKEIVIVGIVTSTGVRR